MIVEPKREGDVTAFFKWLTNTHAVRWRVAHRTIGYGAIYQGRFRSFPVQPDHLLTAAHYVERDVISESSIKDPADWRYSSLWARGNGSDELKAILAPWPGGVPNRWVDRIRRPLVKAQLDRYELSLKRGRPYGDDAWVLRTAQRLDLMQTLRNPFRPKKLESAA